MRSVSLRSLSSWNSRRARHQRLLGLALLGLLEPAVEHVERLRPALLLVATRELRHLERHPRGADGGERVVQALPGLGTCSWWCGATSTGRTCAALRPYIREFKPVMIGVDGGADALLEAGDRPARHRRRHGLGTDEGLQCGAELVVHAYPRDGRAPGQARVQRLGLPAVLCAARGTSEDVALLDGRRQRGQPDRRRRYPFTLDEFLDKDRAGYASTWLTRLRVGGGKLVDAKGVSPARTGSGSPAGRCWCSCWPPVPLSWWRCRVARGAVFLVTSAPSGTRRSTG